VNTETWPSLPLAEWQDTLHTLHMWTQIVGKVKLELTPFLNQWWNIGLYVSARGLTTGPIPTGERIFEVDFDFIDHNLTIQTSVGERKMLPLIPRSVANFYAEFMATLAAMGIEVTINPIPSEVPNPISCDINEVHASYDPDAVNRFWRILVQTQLVLQRFRSGFSGKSSPILFYWGSFDLSHARFSGRPADPPAGAPRFLQIGADQECFTCGFWPGNAGYSGVAYGEPAFFAYHFPSPAGLSEATIRPDFAGFDTTMGEFILRYEDARRAPSPADAVQEFFQSVYEAGADRANWDRALLERNIAEGAHR
jgi:uncharacterized protein DUF5996